MMDRSECDVASLLAVLSTSEEAATCPLGTFARDIRALIRTQQGEDLGNVLAQRSAELLQEEESQNAMRETVAVAYDKLRAELTRVEAQIRAHDHRLQEVTQQRKLCKLALNLVVSGEVPNLIDIDAGAFTAGGVEQKDTMKRAAEDPREDGGAEQPTKAAPEPAPVKSSPSSKVRKAASPELQDTTVPRRNGSPAPSSRSGPNALTSESLLSLLRLPDVKESVLQSAIESYTSLNVAKSTCWTSAQGHTEVLNVMMAIVKHLPEPRPPVQMAELRLLGYVLQAAPVSSPSVASKNMFAVLEALVKEGGAIPILTKLLNSVNDDVKCETLDCLSPIICGTHSLLSANPGSTISTYARKAFLTCGGLQPLVNIVIVSTSEAVLERALICLWGLLTKDETMETEKGEETSIRTQVRQLGGLRAVLDLLYTDSLGILENVSMVIGYITREEASKKEIREIGGLEKITATLRHPSDSIKTKMAGAVWNCASNPENRKHLRELGVIPALIELLRAPSNSADITAYEFVRENAAGGLWNLSVEAESKVQIIDYGGVPILINVMSTSNSVAVVENASGTLWNCSATAEARPVIRKAGGIPVLLSLLNHRRPFGSVRTSVVQSTMPLSDKVIENVAGTLRNCATNDQNKPVIREAGGVELLIKKMEQVYLSSPKDSKSLDMAPLSLSTIEKIASTLWILTISPEIKATVRFAGGIQIFTKILEKSSPSITAANKGNAAQQENLFAAFQPPSTAGKVSLANYQARYSAASLQKLPFATPPVSINTSIKEKIVGVLRNCSTTVENRPAMIEAHVTRCLTAVVLDCFSSLSIFPSGAVSAKSSQFLSPSLQLKEAVASALWYLSRDDKLTPHAEGGLELMCMILLSPPQPSVVLEQVAGALSSLTVNNSENRDAVRIHGGLQALIHFVSDKAVEEYPPGKGNNRSAKSDASTRTYAVLNALLTIRNCTVSHEENIRYCYDIVLDTKSKFSVALLHIIEHGPEDCAKEAALAVKNICAIPAAATFFAQHNCVALATGLSERASSDSVRRAAASLLQILSRASRK